MYFLVIDGKVLDFKYKKIDGFIYNFYIGDIFMGQIFRIGTKDWSAVSWTSNDICPVHGFRSRHAAAELLISMSGIKNKII